MTSVDIQEVCEYTNKNADNLKVKILTIDGKRYLDIRKYYLDGSRLKPTKKGITINEEQFDSMLALLNGKQGSIRSKLRWKG